jgi:hypothetical protein
MIRSVILVVLSAALLAPSEAAKVSKDWRQKLNTRLGSHPSLRPLTAQYEFGWSGVKAADATAEFSRGKNQFQLSLKARTSGFARALWRMDTQGMSIVSAKNLRPLKLEQTEKYAKKTIETKVDFTPIGPRRLKVETPADASVPKPKTYKVSQAHDLHSALLFVRSQRLAPGDTVRICVFPGSSPYYAEVSAGARTKIKAAGKEWSAIPCEIKLQEVGKELELEPHMKFKKATVWLSDDVDRLLLRIEAEVFVGSIWAELNSVKFAGK